MPAEALGPNRHTLSSYPAHMSRVSLERSRGARCSRGWAARASCRGRCARAPGHRGRVRVRVRVKVRARLRLRLRSRVSRVRVRVCERVRVGSE